MFTMHLVLAQSCVPDRQDRLLVAVDKHRFLFLEKKSHSISGCASRFVELQVQVTCDVGLFYNYNKTINYKCSHYDLECP